MYKSFIARHENRAYVRATYRNEGDSVSSSSSSSSSWNTMIKSWKHILSDVPLWLCDVMMMRNSSSLVFESQRFESKFSKKRKKTKKNGKKFRSRLLGAFVKCRPSFFFAMDGSSILR